MTVISVVIATHNPRWLADALRSVVEQTYAGDIEVVLVLDGVPALDIDLDVAQRGRTSLRVVEMGAPGQGIGAVKRAGFNAVRGSILVELDHDDILAPTALQEMSDAFVAHPDATMIYSNLAGFDDETWKPRTYRGWRLRRVQCWGHPLVESRGPEPSAASLARVGTATMPGRAWTREGYDRAGGHDPAMVVGEDYDLVTRTYLTGKLVHIDKCLYFYRYLKNGANTSIVKRREIDRVVRRLAAERFASRTA